jgi:hypothetical protein
LEVFGIVTAFTLAHSVTLSLAVLGFMRCIRLARSRSAAALIVAALNNIFLPSRKGCGLWPLLSAGAGWACLCTADLALPKPALAVSLVSFNLGVEAGQLAIVATFLPLAYLSRRSWLYLRLVLGAGSVCIAAIAPIWLIERSLDVSIFT